MAVISHPAAIGLTLAALQGIPLKEAHTLLSREPASVSVLAWDGESCHILLQDDTSHLGTKDDLAKEKVHARPDFDSNLCFFHLRYVEYGEMMADSLESVWDELSDPRPFNRDILLDDAGRLQTVVGHVEQTPAAFLQYGVTPGWVSLLCVAPACRNAGLGTQLLGQAILHTRSMGGDTLYIPISKKNQYRAFFLHRGFSAVDELDDGRELLAKDIRFSVDLTPV